MIIRICSYMENKGILLRRLADQDDKVIETISPALSFRQ